MAAAHGSLEHLLPAGWTSIVQLWFQEDCPSFDYGGFVVGEDVETATLYGKSKVRYVLLLPANSRTGCTRGSSLFQ